MCTKMLYQNKCFIQKEQKAKMTTNKVAFMHLAVNKELTAPNYIIIINHS